MNVIDVKQVMSGIENLIHANHVLKLSHSNLKNAQFVQELFLTMMSIKNITFANNVLMDGSQWQVSMIVWNLLITVTLISLNMKLFHMKTERKYMNVQCVMKDISGIEPQENASHVRTLMMIVLSAHDMGRNAQNVQVL